ncbi:MAG: DUF2905 domain-containing protein [Deltaproteobacteria bacterium]|nr:DUF2905 domain-containing protein [Deltaproteobacteria bacterium]
MQKILMLIGAGVFVAGLLWPVLEKIPIGRLPGDILISRPGVKIYIPIGTMILVSVIVSVILWLLRK